MSRSWSLHDIDLEWFVECRKSAFGMVFYCFCNVHKNNVLGVFFTNILLVEMMWDNVRGK